MCSTTSAWVNRAEWAHNPTSGSTRAAVISSQPGGSNVRVPEAHRPLQLGPDGQVDLLRLAAATARPAGSGSASDPSPVRVAKDASSSACMRSAGDS